MNKKISLSPTQKVLLGGGSLRNIHRSTDNPTARWAAPTTVTHPWDPAQARLNRHLYPHLFTGK